MARFHVDLLVPFPNETFPTVAVPELQTYATALPYLGYLLKESQTSVLIARRLLLRAHTNPRTLCRAQVGRISVANWARSQVDKGHRSGERTLRSIGRVVPGAIREAVEALSKKMTKHFRKSLPAARERLEDAAPLAWAVLSGEG